MTRTPTPEQQAVLDSTARVRVVRAAPGSGKTWLVAELICQELARRTSRSSGIAALSFTRVGGDEIRKALGHELGHPHYVGTIDAFLFRYVVRPYLNKVCKKIDQVRLIPAEWSPNYWAKGPIGVNIQCRGRGDQKARNYNLLTLCFVGENDGQPVIATRSGYSRALEKVEENDRKVLMYGKVAMWEKCGWLTHSDAAFLAYKLLGDVNYGSSIRAEIIQRFSFMAVDELQDTGYYLGKSIQLLLCDSAVRAVLVGDPDQAIFEFNGARPELFNDFEALPGAASLPLAGSKRCPVDVIAVASHVKESAGEIRPDKEKTGRAVLVRFTDLVPDVIRMTKAIRNNQPNANIKIVTRTNNTVSELIGREAKSLPKLGSPALFHMQRAVVAFRQGRQAAALAGSRAALDFVVFKHEGVDDEELGTNNIDPDGWKELAVRCLLKANAIAESGSLLDWQRAAGEIIDFEIDSFDLEPRMGIHAGKLKPQKRPKWDAPSSDYLPQAGDYDPELFGVSVKTVHQVKGETHDVTILVCPPTGETRCPSFVWWSSEEKHREERRIAYVALTRSQGDLIMCVSEKCYERLCNERQAFIESFQCMTMFAFIGELHALHHIETERE
jgi:DNA helicase II / ATP-dependent DNA helicase PcrA